MAINPIPFAHAVNEQFRRYQLTAFPLADPDLAQQARAMLGEGASSALMRGPYLSVGRALRRGGDIRDLAAAGLVHPALAGILTYSRLFAHQEATWRAARAGRHCLITTGTGSGKTEAFLLPILDHCLRLRDAGAPEGIAAVLVYPMNALAVDQRDRLREMLAGTGITFGLYIGSTPADRQALGGVRQLPQGAGREALQRERAHLRRHEAQVAPWEERLTEADMKEHPPRLLLTNVKQLELLLTRGKDLGMFDGAPLAYLVFDEAHTYTGATGAEVACLIRRLRAFCGRTADEVVCVGTSATLTDPSEGDKAGVVFAQRLFGVDPKRVEVIREEYAAVEWPERPEVPPALGERASDLLARLMKALGDWDVEELGRVVREITGRRLTGRDSAVRLHELLRQNAYVQVLYRELEEPLPLEEAASRIGQALGRNGFNSQAAQAELLCYLALGAAAERDGEVLLRPNLHYFVRGLEGAVAVFPDHAERPQLFFSAEEAQKHFPDRLPTALFPVAVCRNCGQHYLRADVGDLSFADGEPLRGGQAVGDNTLWPGVPAGQGTGVILTDRFLAADDEGGSDRIEGRCQEVHLCRRCGAMHRRQAAACANPRCGHKAGMVRSFLVAAAGKMKSCPACGQRGRTTGSRPYDPIRDLRAVTVADVHILGQDMINSAEETDRKLLVFSDNRQDAAFQAGWMQDHARRYRLRHLVYDFLRRRPKDDPASPGDVVEHLFQLFRQDRALAQALAPEVYEGQVVDRYGHTLDERLRKYLRILVLRELATGFKQRDSLENWGLLRVIYHPVRPGDAFIDAWAGKTGVPQASLAEGVAALFDIYRRGRYLHDVREPIFSRWWREGDEEVQRGFLPFLPFPPKGLKLTRDSEDDKRYVTQLCASRGVTSAQDLVGKWGLKPPEVREFLEELWEAATGTWQLLVPASLQGNRGRQLPHTTGTYQIASSVLGLVAQEERYRCGVCQRVHARPVLRDRCTARFCPGQVHQEGLPEDDYNVALLRRPFSMLRAQEHSAQVPPERREEIERHFKAVPGRYNCLVATPTLELGVDIGALDMVLMRNVPPTAANYWQRAGRAGRRQRMAVIYTYCRPSPHDSFFFRDPVRLLGGQIRPPRFNLHNEVLLRKHVHATVISELLRTARRPGAEETAAVMQDVLPNFIHGYLFHPDRRYRQEVPEIEAPFRELVSRHQAEVADAVSKVFGEYWPREAADQVTPERLDEFIREMPEQLQESVQRIHQRMMWVLRTKERLQETSAQGLLEAHEQQLLRRCERYLQALHEEDRMTYTLSVLANEGFLPGYGLFDGGVRAFAQRVGRGAEQNFSFEVARQPALAVREFVPGNLIYANGGRYRCYLYHMPVGQRHEMQGFQVEPQSGWVGEQGISRSGYAAAESLSLQGMPVGDVDLAFISRISDEESYRFQMPVVVLGYMEQIHNGATLYTAGRQEIQHRLGQGLRLVNVGPADRVRERQLGYPVCPACGAMRSPFASERELDHFREVHRQRCGAEPEWLGLWAGVRADGLLFPGLRSKQEAASLGEALRLGAEQVLEMTRDDLQVVHLPADDGTWGLFLYDPMPGGSGLLQQLLERWEEVTAGARETLEHCPGACAASCYDCLRTYRNIFFHEFLDRHVAVEMLLAMGRPKFVTKVPPVGQITQSDGQASNKGEERLHRILLEHGFPAFEQQVSVPIGMPFEQTVPDLIYRDDTAQIYVAIYLDGLSKAVHGDARRRQQDRFIRQQLEGKGWQVIEIAGSDLDDPEALRLHLRRIAFALRRQEQARTL